VPTKRREGGDCGGSERGGVKRPSIWFWIAIGYLVATVVFNVWNRGWSSIHDLPLHTIDVAANLGCKIVAIGLLVYRRGEGVYFLAAAFLIGLSGTIWEFYSWDHWDDLPAPAKISRIGGFVISLAIILYMAALKKRGFLKAGRTSN
jgi:hypothetical protein